MTPKHKGIGWHLHKWEYIEGATVKGSWHRYVNECIKCGYRKALPHG